MNNIALLVRLEAKPGMEQTLMEFLKSALPLANAEPLTTHWFALQMGPSTFGIFEAFPGEDGRVAHLDGPIAAALMEKAEELLSAPPVIEKADIIAVK